MRKRLSRTGRHTSAPSKPARFKPAHGEPAKYASHQKSARALLLLLCAAMLALAPFKQTAERSAQAAQAAGTPALSRALNCGFDAHGAERELYNHRLNSLRASKRARGLGAQAEVHSARVEAIGDVAVIEDDGAIIMPPHKFDMKNRAVLFTPDGDGYRVTREEIAFSDDVGFKLTWFFGASGNVLQSLDNGYRDMELREAAFPFFGALYDKIFIGSNGYVTFTRGDTTSDPSVAALAAELPRIAPLWANLNPTGKGAVYYNRLSGRHIVTWKGIPHAQFGGANTAQLSLFDDGRIAFVYKKVNARAALVGISPGRPDLEAQQIDISRPPEERIAGPFFESFSKSKRLDIPALTKAFYSANADTFDTLYIWTDFAFDNGPGFAHSFNVRNDIRGIGLTLFDRGKMFGSNERLSTVITMGNIADAAQWPADPDARVVGINSAISIVCHEQGHRWLSYIRFDAEHDIKDDLLGRDNSHWSFLVDTRTNSDGTFSSLMEGNSWRDNGNGTFATIQTDVNHFSSLDLYLMGLIPPEEVGDISYLVVDPPLKALLREGSPKTGVSLSAQRKATNVAQIIEREGRRVPEVGQAPKDFRAAFILLIEADTQAAASTVEKLDRYRRSIERYFSVATRRLASLSTALASD